MNDEDTFPVVSMAIMALVLAVVIIFGGVSAMHEGKYKEIQKQDDCP